MSGEFHQFLKDFVLLDRRLADHVDLDAALYLIDGNLLHHVADTTNDPGLIGHPLDVDDSLAGKSFLEKKIVIDSNLGRHRTFTDMKNGTNLFKAVACLPILTDSSSIGVITLASTKDLDLEPHIPRLHFLSVVLAYVEAYRQKDRLALQSYSRSLGSALAELRRELRYTQANVATLMRINRITVSSWESGRQSPSLGQLRAWCTALGLLAHGERSHVQVVDISAELLRTLQHSPEEMARLSSQQFEHFVAGRLDRMGYDVRLTGPTSLRDGGVDLVAVPKVRTLGTFVLAGQVKHHSTGRKTGRSAADRLLSWKDGPFKFGLLVTNTSFSKDALWAAAQPKNKDFLLLRNFFDLKRWLEENFWSEDEWRELPDEINLAPGLTIKVPKPTLPYVKSIWPMDIEIQ